MEGGCEPAAAGSREKSPPATQHKKGKNKYHRKQKDGTAESPASAGATPSRANKSQKKSPFSSKMDPPFEEYWTKEAVQHGLKSGDLVQGALRINQRNYENAYVDDPDGGGDYYISGILRRNRALERDVVVIQVLPPDKWLDEERFQPIGDAEKHTTLEDMAPALKTLQVKETVPATITTTSQPTQQPPTLIDRLYTVPDDIQVGREQRKPEGNEGEREAHERLRKELMKYRRTAQVVYIVEKGHSRVCAGHLKAFDKAKELALLSPKDNKIPRILLPLSNCPDDYVQNPKKYENTLFICRITSWEKQSPFSQGELMRSVGEAGEIEPETESFLIENDIDFGDFSAEALDCLPKQTPWTIPQDELSNRRDFRSECVFTIDPDTARDLDDALHVKELGKDVYEVGVHIADVSYFVKAGTALDIVASERATSVYLVQRVIPMLPRLLCEQLCSLNPDKDRLAFSVVWKLTAKGEFKDEWMGRSIIRSCSKLSYSHAQAMIDEPLKQWKDNELPAITNGFTASQVSWAVNTLNELAKALRHLRQSKGTLRLNQPKLKFNLSKKTGLPNGCDVYIQRESNRLIEEFMLLTNMAVAHKIWRVFPNTAMLRRHPMPKEKSAQFLVQQCENLGIVLDVSSAASIQESLDRYEGNGEDEELKSLQKTVLVSQCSKIMELARYFCTGMIDKEEGFNHFALNVPRYTHFTSPIRRYADIIVHRQLASALGEGPDFTMTDEEVEAQAHRCNKKKKPAKTIEGKMIVHTIYGPDFTMIDEEVEAQAHRCNKKKKSAKTVEELSLQMFFSIFIRECRSICARGIVVQVLDKAFDVLIHNYGVIKRVYCDQLQLEKFEFHRGNVKGESKLPCLVLEWKGPDNSSSIKQELTTMSIVDVQLTSSHKPLQYDAKILPPQRN